MFVLTAETPHRQKMVCGLPLLRSRGGTHEKEEVSPRRHPDCEGAEGEGCSTYLINYYTPAAGMERVGAGGLQPAVHAHGERVRPVQEDGGEGVRHGHDAEEDQALVPVPPDHLLRVAAHAAAEGGVCLPSGQDADGGLPRLPLSGQGRVGTDEEQLPRMALHVLRLDDGEGLPDGESRGGHQEPEGGAEEEGCADRGAAGHAPLAPRTGGQALSAGLHDGVLHLHPPHRADEPEGGRHQGEGAEDCGACRMGEEQAGRGCGAEQGAADADGGAEGAGGSVQLLPLREQTLHAVAGQDGCPHLQRAVHQAQEGAGMA